MTIKVFNPELVFIGVYTENPIDHYYFTPELKKLYRFNQISEHKFVVATLTCIDSNEQLLRNALSELVRLFYNTSGFTVFSGYFETEIEAITWLETQGQSPTLKSLLRHWWKSLINKIEESSET